MKSLRIALLVISDRASTGQREDKCEAAISSMLKTRGHNISFVEVVPDEIGAIQGAITRFTDENGFELVITAGGTGLSVRDVTPQATLPLLDYEIPGIPEAMRRESLKITPYAALSRGFAGARKNSLIINLPGSPKAAVENLESVFDAVCHGVEKLLGDMSDCKPPKAKGRSAESS